MAKLEPLHPSMSNPKIRVPRAVGETSATAEQRRSITRRRGVPHEDNFNGRASDTFEKVGQYHCLPSLVAKHQTVEAEFPIKALLRSVWHLYLLWGLDGARGSLVLKV